MFIKLLVTTFIAIATYNINAIECEDFKVQLTEKQYFDKLDKLCYQKEFRDVGIRIFRKYWAMHLMELRNKKKSDILRWDNLRYAETILNVIPTELARAIFNVNSKQFQYNIMDDKILEIQGCTPATYNSSNWNYIVLINIIDKILNSEVKTIVEADLDGRYWSDERYQDKEKKIVFIKTTDQVIDETIDNMVNTYSQYKSNIIKAKNDVLYYFKELELNNILDKMRTARFYIVAKYCRPQKLKSEEENNNLINPLDKNSISKALEELVINVDRITAYMSALPKCVILNETMVFDEDRVLTPLSDQKITIRRAKCVLYTMKFSGVAIEYTVLKCIEYNRCGDETARLLTVDVNQNWCNLDTEKTNKDNCFVWNRKKEYFSTELKKGTESKKNLLWEFVSHLFGYDYNHKTLTTGLKNVDSIAEYMSDEPFIYRVAKQTVKFYNNNERILEAKAPYSLYIYLINIASQLQKEKTIIDTLQQIEIKLCKERKNTDIDDFLDNISDIISKEMEQTIYS